MEQLGARVVIAGTHSGVGKTTVATGIMAALRARGLRVASAKVGPDYIDPGYHRLATGRDAHSLDVFMSGEGVVVSLAARASAGSDVLVVEGVMGLFDGAGVDGVDGSSAHVSRLIDAPVILVVDASAMSGSVAALVHGFATFDSRVALRGVVLNRVGSDAHARMLRDALAPLNVTVIGAIARDDSLTWRERHLGLVPVAENSAALRSSMDRLANVIESSLDLDAVLAISNGAPPRSVTPPPTAQHVGASRIALAAGPAFSFVYPENLELLAAAGAELVPFDPLSDSHIPEGCGALYAGGGFPEEYAAALGENRVMLEDIRLRVAAGLVTWAECGGLLLLCESLGAVAMAGVLKGVHAKMSERLTLGYRRVTTRVPGPFGPAGTQLRGHEFHRSVTTPTGEALEVVGRHGSSRTGFMTPHLFASYLHQHLSATPTLVERFAAAARLGSAQ